MPVAEGKCLVSSVGFVISVVADPLDVFADVELVDQYVCGLQAGGVLEERLEPFTRG